MVHCLYCSPSEDAYNWCAECIQRSLDEMEARKLYYASWQWYAFKVGGARKAVGYTRAIFARNERHARSHMKRAYRYEVAEFMGKGCNDEWAIAERAWE